MKIKLTILFILFFHIGFSQCEDSDKIKLGGSYTSKTNNYIPFEVKYKDSIYKKDVFYPFDIKIIEKYTDLIFKKANQYIIKRGGKKFFEKIKFDHLEVNYKDSVKVVYENQNLYDLSKQNVTYWMIYTYLNENIKYAFGLELNKEGDLISENMFPNIETNIEFENLTDFCKALENLKLDKRFSGKTIKNIELTYLEKTNSFCWLIEENAIPNKEFGKWEEKNANLYFINANTNKLELVEERQSISIGCTFGPLSKQGKKILRKEKRKKKRESNK